MKPSPPGRIVFAAIFVIFVYGMIAAMPGVLLPVFPLTVTQKSTIALAQAVGLIIASLCAGPPSTGTAERQASSPGSH